MGGLAAVGGLAHLTCNFSIRGGLAAPFLVGGLAAPSRLLVTEKS